jgi:ribosomal protein L37AE/L43A
MGDFVMNGGWDDLDDGLAGAKTDANAEQIRKEAHIVNGGEATFDCPKCGGSGYWRAGYPCFKCKGSGAVSKGVIAAAKGKVTKAANIAKWLQDHDAEMVYLNQRADRWAFAASMIDSVREWGKLTDNQLAAVQRAMANDAAKKEERAVARVANAPKVEIAAIQALFAKAVDNDVKRPIFRAEGLQISKAPASGKNAGALYVKAGDTYAGKIVGGKFHKAYGVDDVTDTLMKVAADPLAEAMKYGRKTGACAFCGRTLVDPVSIRANVGPICADNWGVDWKRDDARESLKEDEA